MTEASIGEGFEAFIPSPVGTLGLQTKEGQLSHIAFLADEQITSIPSMAPHLNPIFDAFSNYFKNPCPFDIALFLMGTPFQKRVWSALREIPVGMTMTYGDLAKKLNASAQAIGGACKKNPCPIVIPCHRIVARQSLGGYFGALEGPRLAIKTWLLHHEGVIAA